MIALDRCCFRGAASAGAPGERNRTIRCDLRRWNGQCVSNFRVGCTSAPRYAHWACLIAVVLGVGALCLTNTDFAARLSPFARRGIELVDYLALAAVVPLACWVGGLFGFVRGLSLT